MSKNKPGLLTIKQPDPKKTPSHDGGLESSFSRFFIKNINYYSYSRAKWYDISPDYKAHTHKIIERLKDVDASMQNIIVTGECLEVFEIFLTKYNFDFNVHEICLMKNWEQFMEYRRSVQVLSENCIRKEMKFCRKENLEQHIWKILYYNLIEFFKVLTSDSTSDQQCAYFQMKLIEIIDDGLVYYNHMLDVLENTYDFQLSDLLQTNTEYRGE